MKWSFLPKYARNYLQDFCQTSKERSNQKNKGIYFTNYGLFKKIGILKFLIQPHFRGYGRNPYFDFLNLFWDFTIVWLQYDIRILIGTAYLINTRQIVIIFYYKKTWLRIACWVLCFYLNLPDLILELFCFDVQNNLRIQSGKFRWKHRNQLTISGQVLN